jgi:hypothetical protein
MSRITTPFNAESTAAEVIAGVDLTGKRAVVTGGTSGIELETAHALASVGAQVTLAVRNTDAGQRAAADIQRHLDRATLRSIGAVDEHDRPLAAPRGWKPHSRARPPPCCWPPPRPSRG